MKNKKLIPITVCLVAAVLVGILGLSKFFETTWQNENTVDNNLSVNDIEQNETVKFDYPYIDYEGLINSTDKKVTERYKFFIEDPAQKIMYDKGWIYPDIETKISYQDVANICGEYFKYSLGITEQSAFPSYIQLYDELDGWVYSYWYLGDEFTLRAYVDVNTGEFKGIVSTGPILFDYKEGLGYQWTVERPDDEICDILQQYTYEIISLANIKKDIPLTNMEYLYVGSERIPDADPPCGCYIYYVQTQFQDGEYMLFRYITGNKKDFQIEKISPRKFEVFDRL